MSAKKFLSFFFWFAFAAFLAASIPHVSYFFRAFEPNDVGLDWWYWSVSTFIAVSIDVTVFLLSMTVAGLQRQRKAKSLVFSVWLFIVVLSSLSWYMNNQYAVHFANTGMLSATPITIPFVNILITDINPLIASCFQVLAIAYTWISDKISSDEAPKKAAELEQEANELAALTIQKQRIAAIKRENNVSGATALFDASASILGHIRSKVKASPQADSVPIESKQSLNEEVSSETSEKVNEGLNTQVNDDVYLEDEEVSTPLNEEVNAHVYQAFPITDKLTKRNCERLPNSDGDQQVNKSVRKMKPSVNSPAKQIQRILQKDQTIGPTELAARVGCTKGYASQVKTQFLASLQEEN